MKKLLSVFVLMIVAVGLFASGQSDVEATASSIAGVDPSGATVTYWHQHSKAREEALNVLVDEFNGTNEWSITVNAEYIGSYDQIYNKMITAISGGSMPDLVVAYQNQAATYWIGEGLVDLQPYVDDPKWGLGGAIDDYFEGYIDQDISAQFGNVRLGFPPNRSIEVLMYNADWLKDLGFDGPPETWDEFYEVCKAATDKDADQYGYAIRTDASNVFAQIISRGGEIAKADGTGYQFNTPEMKASMELMKKVYDDGYAIKIAERYGDQTDFANKKILFMAGSTSGLPYIDSAISGSEKGAFEWTVAAMPHTTMGAVMDVYGASLSVTQSTPEKQLAAWLFIKWMTEPTQQAAWVEASNYFPVRKSTAASLSSYFEKNPKYEDAYNILMGSEQKAEPPYAGYDEVRDAISAAFNAILDGANIDRTIADLEEEVNEIHAEVSE